MPPEGLDEAREAFAQEIPQATRQRDQAGRFVTTSSKPEPIFQPRDVEGDDRGDTSDGGADPRFLEQERKAADGRSEEGDEQDSERKRVSNNAKRAAGPGADQGDDGAAEDQPPERIGQEADDAGEDAEKPDKGDGSEPEPGEDPGPRYKIQVDGEEREVSLNEALRGYQREETFNHRMRQMVEVAKAIDQRGSQAQAAREAYVQLCANQEQEFAALIPQEPNWDQLYRDNPQAAHALENNYRAVYGTLNAIRQRRAAAQQEAFNDNAQRTASYARAEFNKFCSKNKLTDQQSVDRAIGYMRRTAMEAGFNEDEIGSTYDERMLTVLNKAAKYDNMMRNKPLPVQPERGGALQPGSAPRIGNGQARTMNDAQKRLAASGRVDDAALVMAQFLRPR
jgi:hypothetical protein